MLVNVDVWRFPPIWNEKLIGLRIIEKLPPVLVFFLHISVSLSCFLPPHPLYCEQLNHYRAALEVLCLGHQGQRCGIAHFSNEPEFPLCLIFIPAAPIPPQCGIPAPCKCWSWACRSLLAPPPVAADVSSLWHSTHSPVAHRAQPRQQGTGRWEWRAEEWWSMQHSSHHGKGRPPGPARRRGREGPPLGAMADYLGV